MTNAETVLTAARALRPKIIAMREEAERQRRLPDELSDAMAAAGLYQMYLPRALGGLELDPVTVFRVIEEIARADGSASWCLMNGNLPPLFSGWLMPKAAQEMFGTPPDLRAAGSLRPQGRAWPAEGGFRVTGQWNFVSGLHNATWLWCTCLVMDGDKPSLTAAGGPVIRAMWFPASSATFLDTWSVMGLRASGSHDCAATDLFVPAAHTTSFAEPPFQTGPLYRPRSLFAFVFSVFAANALGIAQGAIDALVELASDHASSRNAALLKDRPAVQEKAARAVAIVEAARCFALNALADLWAALVADNPDPSAEIPRARLSQVYAINEAVRAVDIVFHAAGTNAIHTANPLERQFRDIHVAIQHNAAFPVHFESYGRIMMGLRPAASEPGW